MEFISTGIKGVDQLLGGKGVPRGRVVFVLGAPGSGKTTFALQFLRAGALNREPGVYVSLDENPTMVKAHVASLGLEIEELEKKSLLAMIDASPIRLIPGETRIAGVSVGKRDFALISLVKAINEAVNKVGAKRLVVDPLSTLIVHYPKPAERRMAFLDLMEALVETECTSLLVSELSESSFNRRYQFEEFLAHGVIILNKIVEVEGVKRVFTIEKMRGVDHDHQPHPYRITYGGIEVYPEELVI